MIQASSIACGMYAFTPALKSAWHALLSPLGSLTSQPLEIAFSTDDKSYQHPGLLIGHTCGYPYLCKWQPTHELVCVPQFNIPGCHGLRYCSWFVTAAENASTNLDDFQGKVVAINGHNSNSGMNVLRYAFSRLYKNKPLFKDVLITGTHLETMRAIASNSAALGAIDAVSYHHIVEAFPELMQQTKIIGQSVMTAGLPFIAHRNLNIDRREVTDALNQSLSTLSPQFSKTLRIDKFSLVKDTDYQLITDIESTARNNGYAKLS